MILKKISHLKSNSASPLNGFDNNLVLKFPCNRTQKPNPQNQPPKTKNEKPKTKNQKPPPLKNYPTKFLGSPLKKAPTLPTTISINLCLDSLVAQA